jgi:LPS sulfotransferase NodH
MGNAESKPVATSNQRRPRIDNPKYLVEWQRLQHRLRLLRKWWLRPHLPYQPVFVIATCRSGSNLLVSYLDQMPSVTMLGELLCTLLPHGPRHERIPPKQAIKHIRYCLQGERGGVRGCKLMLYQLTNCQLTLDTLDAAFPQAKYIVLYRESLADQYVSHQKAIATRQFLLRPGEQRKRSEMTIDPAHLRAYCDDIRRGYRNVLDHSWLHGRSVVLSYEQLVAEPVHWLEQHICPLLGVPFVAPTTKLCKQNTEPLAQQITNYRDVASLLHSPLCRQHHHGPAPLQGQPRAA